MFRTFLFACSIVGMSNLYGQGREIPLDEIWGLDLPGTTKIQELERPLAAGKLPSEFSKESLCIKIERLLNKRLKENETAPPAFFVKGTGLTALKNTVVQLEKYEEHDYKTPEIITVPADEEVSLVFFTYMSGRYVYLDRVLQGGNRFQIEYHYVGHWSTDVSNHLALIPVGKLSVGPGEVRMVRLAPTHQSEARVIVDDNGHKRVSQGFSFEAVDKGEQDEGETTTAIGTRIGAGD